MAAKGEGFSTPRHFHVLDAVRYIARNLKNRCCINELENLRNFLRPMDSSYKLYGDSYCILQLLLDRWGILKNRQMGPTVLEIDTDLVTTAIKETLGLYKLGNSRHASKPEGLYKPGDRVFFISQRLQASEYYGEVTNHLIGVIKDWDISNKDGTQQAVLERAFHIIKVRGVDSRSIDYSSFNVEAFINDEGFGKSLYTAICDSKEDVIIEGLLEAIPVDEKHFERLNSIVAKIAKPRVDGVENVGIGSCRRPKVDEPYNPMEGQIFIAGMGWFPKGKEWGFHCA